MSYYTLNYCSPTKRTILNNHNSIAVGQISRKCPLGHGLGWGWGWSLSSLNNHGFFDLWLINLNLGPAAERTVLGLFILLDPADGESVTWKVI